jgi:hypothetical protein
MLLARLPGLALFLHPAPTLPGITSAAALAPREPRLLADPWLGLNADSGTSSWLNATSLLQLPATDALLQLLCMAGTGVLALSMPGMALLAGGSRAMLLLGAPSPGNPAAPSPEMDACGGVLGTLSCTCCRLLLLLWKPCGRWHDWLAAAAAAARPGSLRLLLRIPIPLLLLLEGSGVFISEPGPGGLSSLLWPPAAAAPAATATAASAAAPASLPPRLTVLECRTMPGRGGSMWW